MGSILFVIVGCVMIYHYYHRYYGLNLFSRREFAGTPKKRSRLPVDAESQYLLCTFSIAAKVVAADGEITQAERDKLSEFMKNVLDLSKREEKLAWEIFNNAINDDLEIRDYAKSFRRYFPDRVQLTDKVITTLLGLAACDGYVHPKEDQAIRSTALLLDISAPAYDRMKSENLTNQDRYH